MKSEKDSRRHWVLLLLLLSYSEAFLTPSLLSRPFVCVSCATLSQSIVDEQQEHNARAARFHIDMVRLLESRSHLRVETTTIRSRRERPPILETDTDGAERVLAMLQHMVDLGVATEESYAIVMDAILMRGRLRWKKDARVICAADQLELLLQQLQYQDCAISIQTYNRVLESYATCATPRGDRNYARRAQELLDHMMEEEDAFDVDSLVHTLHAWAWQQGNLQPGECALHAQELLELIEERTDDACTLMQCYDWVLEAWSKSRSEGSPQRAYEAFLRMKQLNHTTGVEIGLPNAESYSNAILAWSKCAHAASAERAHELLHEMVKVFQSGGLYNSQPELIAFNGCITAWARVGRPEKAESILWLMEELRPSCSGLIPDVLTYNAVLHAHVLSRDKKRALENIIAIVDHMEAQCEDQPAIAPDSFTYNTLMKAWVQSGQSDAPEQAEAILGKMERLGSDFGTRDFNVVINAYAKSSDDRFAAQKAHRLLRRMQGSRNVRPDVISYTSVMECYSKSADPDASVAALELLETCFEESEADPSLRPNLRTFTMAIAALAHCPRQGNAAKARDLLTRLEKLYETTGDSSLKPNEYPYNYVINCAANTMGPDKLDAFSIATKTFQEMRCSLLVKPDSFTYAFWIKACNNLLPPRSELHTKCVRLAFEECKKDGLVTKEVLNRLQKGSSPKVISNLLGDNTVGYRSLQVQDVPPSWSRNTKRNKR